MQYSFCALFNFMSQLPPTPVPAEAKPMPRRKKAIAEPIANVKVSFRFIRFSLATRARKNSEEKKKKKNL